MDAVTPLSRARRRPRVFVVVLATVPLAGGHLERLADLRFRAGWLVLVAFGVQVLIVVVVPDGPPALSRAVHVGTYALAGLFVWLNRDLPGLRLIALGGALNFAAILANGGVMPASREAVAAAGLRLEDAFENSAPLAEPRLLALGDVFATPAFLPVDNVYSVGDLLIALGAFLLLHRTCGSRLPRVGRMRPYRASGSSGTGASPE